MHRHILACSLVVFALGVAINLWAVWPTQASSFNHDADMADRLGQIVSDMQVVESRVRVGGLMMLAGFFSGVVGLVWSLYQKPTMKANET